MQTIIHGLFVGAEKGWLIPDNYSKLLRVNWLNIASEQCLYSKIKNTIMS